MDGWSYFIIMQAEFSPVLKNLNYKNLINAAFKWYSYIIAFIFETFADSFTLCFHSLGSSFNDKSMQEKKWKNKNLKKKAL